MAVKGIRITHQGLHCCFICLYYIRLVSHLAANYESFALVMGYIKWLVYQYFKTTKRRSFASKCMYLDKKCHSHLCSFITNVILTRIRDTESRFRGESYFLNKNKMGQFIKYELVDRKKAKTS